MALPPRSKLFVIGGLAISLTVLVGVVLPLKFDSHPTEYFAISDLKNAVNIQQLSTVDYIYHGIADRFLQLPLLLLGCRLVFLTQLQIFRVIKNCWTCNLDCAFHNVAEIKNLGTNLLFGTINLSYKKAWFEYDGKITLGIDVKKVKISKSGKNNVVQSRFPMRKCLVSLMRMLDLFPMFILISYSSHPLPLQNILRHIN